MNIEKDIIYPVLEDLQKTEDIDFKISSELNIFGADSLFDSLFLVKLILGVEEKILEIYGKSISLTSENAMSRSSSPFRTISSLTSYIEEVLGD